MTEFKAIELEDKELFNKFFERYTFKTYEYAFSTLYLWRDMCKTSLAVINDALIIRKEERNKGQYFMAPIKAERQKLKDIVQELMEYKKASTNMPFLFRDIEEEFLLELKSLFGDKVEYEEDTNNFDYIYSTSELIELSGKKFHGKKNHFNSFVKSYDYEIKDIKEENIGEQCIFFARQWLENKEDANYQLQYELKVIEDMILNFHKLDLEGMAVKVNNEIVAFTLGEKLNEDMAVIHIEKGNNDYKGVYAFINKMFLTNYFSDVTTVNRQEDLGVEGLRKAKESYNPIRLEKKYNVNINI
ncbi:MAG: DUF2156 domain-containing protein [Clostridiales bacterium]|uniref:DUF2156 domain-containing protein n=1 Tax=Clostridium sp. N3C TaxID=1776758 RepID=UPI00092E1A74|nr:phosphatidylglycerol lysyltransferase domain-containing protein [Clostridium sp. N3C]NLZ49613.1 DUF2156 domain-containing protein [Clostridiales bacterium]SCN22905.1 hypothetical protein N3C_1015 [Clostridium sp. N3C]